jgi:hypothetical protein
MIRSVCEQHEHWRARLTPPCALTEEECSELRDFLDVLVWEYAHAEEGVENDS